ncbi:MAG: CBS domain-containing protein [Desulfobacterales bacterium]|nr:CBS domain-containing protein [Desulfobacterales bacterium]
MKQESQIYPFSTLSKQDQEKLTNAFSYEKVQKGTVLLEQEITRVENLYILSKGHAQYYYELNNTKILSGEVKIGDNFGGISILLNDAVSIRSLKILEDSVFITLKADFFLSVCKENSKFQDYFTNEFGKCMLNKSFSGIISRRIKDKEFNLPFFNRPIRTIFQPNIITCPMETSIENAAIKMSRNNASAILIKKDKRTIQGIVTDADLRKKAVAKKMDLSQPISNIMSSPLISISADCQVFEVFLSMIENDKRHLAVYSQSGDITGIVSEKDLISAQTKSTYLLIKTVKSAKTIQEIENIHSKLEKMLLDPIKNGASPEYITRLISMFSDAIIDKIIRFSLDKMGPSPCKFVFLTMGSEGREEQTLISDQDNAIVYEDSKYPEKAKKYFDKLSHLICDQLNMTGYRFCGGNNMAKNPKWCQPLSKWKQYFNTWIRTSNPENLLHSSIFFDFRGTWGDLTLADELKDYLLSSIKNWAGFLRNLTENATYFKPPISRFGKFVVKTQGDQKGSLDIKLGMMPITDFTRVYALKNGISQTNTLTRLFRLYTRRALTSKEYTDIVKAYNYMMQLRFLRQITTIMDEEKIPDNYINPHNLSALDQTMLKEIFKMIEKLQQNLSVEFTGIV